jgi:hypothetical protein
MLPGETPISNPLPDSTVSALQTCETAALAAALIIASSFPEILDFATRASARRPSELASEPPKRARGRPKRCNGHVRETPNQCDERLVEAMKANLGANIAALAAAIGKSRTSTVTALHRLRDADLAESRNGVWSLVKPPTPKETARWIEPVAASRRARCEERAHA